jgi:ribonuclease BN (tRNA processing enzyme)
MSARQAAEVAEDANLSVLIPTHIRDRYGSVPYALREDIDEVYDGEYLIPSDGSRYRMLTRDYTGRAHHISDVLDEKHQ